jgi:acetyl-CoA carboxylase carboxyl transferase subunit beta
MAWFKKAKKPKAVREDQRQRSSVPEGLWVKCDGCKEIIYNKELERNLRICPKCGHHFRIDAPARLQLLLDEPQPRELFAAVSPADPLGFKDSKRYADRLRVYQQALGTRDAVIVVDGHVEEIPVVVAVMDYRFMGGSMGQAVGEAFVAGVEAAIEDACPYIIFTAAGGARMQEGILSLMQMPRATVAIQMLHDAGLPYIVVLTDPTTGGVTASFAMLGDLNIAEPAALIGFAGPRVIVPSSNSSSSRRCACRRR